MALNTIVAISTFIYMSKIQIYKSKTLTNKVSAFLKFSFNYI